MPPKKAAATARAPKRAAAKKAAPATKKATAATTKKATAASTKKAAPATKAKPAATTAAAAKKGAKATPAAAKKSQTTAVKRKAEDDSDNSDDEVAEGPEPKKKTATKKAAAAKPAAARKVAAPRTTTKKAAAVPAPAQPKKAVVSGESDKENDVAKSSGQTKANTKRKRAASAKVEEAETEKDERPAKKPRKAAVAAAPKKIAVPKRRLGKKINEAPTDALHVFVFGEGSSGELGLGSKKIDGKKPLDVKRPRLNPNLAADKVGVVQVACGGMHVVALTKDNKILTWGVNDQGALGRDTTWEGGLRDVEDEDSDDEDSDDSGLNPNESMPTEIDTTNIEPDTKFVQVVASDSASFALTEDGVIYGWGTFRSSDGILGFNDATLVQKIPILLPDLKGIKQIAAGSNHVLALDNKGKVQAWGCGQQNQLGRKVFDRDMKTSLKPNGIGSLPVRGSKPVKVACGSYHSFAIDQEGRVFAWGLNNYAELGIEDNAGEDDAAELKPRLVESLSGYKIADIAGGEHHSLACTDDGKLLAWGRIDGHQVGLSEDVYTKDNAIYDERNKPRILKEPTVVPGVSSVEFVAAGTDHSFSLTAEGKAYSWGFSANYQTGQGTDDDIETPTLIDNTAVRGKKLTFAGAGGQYSILASVAENLAN